MASAVPTQLPSPPPITDRIALGALTHTFPPELVDRVVEQTGRAEQRRRLLPARVVVYFVLALALYSHAAYEEVMRCLVEGLGWAQQARRGRRSWPWWHVPGASALAEARTRLGEAPLRLLFAEAARPLATAATKGAWYRRWRLLVLDGTCLDVPDSPANQVFGRSKSGRGEGVGAFPQVRVVGLVEAGTHAIVDADAVRALRKAGAGPAVISDLSRMTALDIGATGEGSPVAYASETATDGYGSYPGAEIGYPFYGGFYGGYGFSGSGSSHRSHHGGRFKPGHSMRPGRPGGPSRPAPSPSRSVRTRISSGPLRGPT